jgi:hypothetical protein
MSVAALPAECLIRTIAQSAGADRITRQVDEARARL